MARFCKTCEIEKCETEFYKRSGKHSHLRRGSCKCCIKKQNKERFESKSPEEKARIKEIKKKQIKEWKKRNPNYSKDASRIRYQNPINKIKQNIATRLRASLAAKFWRKDNSTIEILGCSIPKLKKHLEDSFEANYGIPREYIGSFKVHIDHIIPASSATTKEEVYKLNHYTNLQYLLAKDNMNKKASLTWELT
jgi:hypothetical protein